MVRTFLEIPYAKYGEYYQTGVHSFRPFAEFRLHSTAPVNRRLRIKQKDRVQYRRKKRTVGANPPPTVFISYRKNNPLALHQLRETAVQLQ